MAGATMAYGTAKILSGLQDGESGKKNDDLGSGFVRAAFVERFRVDKFDGIEGMGRIYRPVDSFQSFRETYRRCATRLG